MSLDMKVAVVLAPVCLVAMVYALTQGDWDSAGSFALIQVLLFVNYRGDKRYRSEERNRSPEAPEHPNEA